MKLKYVFTCTLLAGSLLFIDIPNAQAKKVKNPLSVAENSNLTFKEQWCQYFGRLTAGIVNDRDNMVPLTVEISRLRTIMKGIYKYYPHLANEEQLTKEMIDTVSLLYVSPEYTATQARHAFEIGCMNPELTAQKHNTILR